MLYPNPPKVQSVPSAACHVVVRERAPGVLPVAGVPCVPEVPRELCAVLPVIQVHVSVEGGHGELLLGHLLRELLHPSPRVTENDGLGNVDGIVKVAERVELVLLNKRMN